ncbi:MAG: SurA N-terminal domain-containing protein [Proteobacteria bacterium]|jgi:peptidyl-prolyl cis-trans isomerase D|nr:peptidylprolyl isomerase [Methylibium sp.]MBY0367770.1 SurA N-terminal domain-containing protein [Burkholderiaceae bacterium]MCH8855397.1 SurA N-terminal domain-containing protein [Pseudomonadota bacterium]|mmetsp:Transcript_22121/g.87018  ORF Transcript_22121/g.87018 Transcript_22121/m.87018 type:complete len:638 (+) Transcript_22121:803-2716(+)
MFDFVRQHNRLFQFILLLLILPSFAFVGMQGYTNMMGGANAGVASVDGRKITQAEWDNAHREQSQRIRGQNPAFDAKLLDTPEIKRQALESLVTERTLQAAASHQHFTPSAEAVNARFWNDPQFAFLRNPDGTVNKGLLAAQGMTPSMFLERLRQDYGLRQVSAPIETSVVAGDANARLAFDSLLQQREVQLQRFGLKDFAAKISPSDADIEAFYKEPANAAKFQLPESAQIQYLVLDIEALKQDVKFSEDDLQTYYKENATRYGVPEERRASHILIKVDRGAPAEQRAKAKAKAEEILAQVRKNPADFAAVAKKNSQDEGSAANGGDLDFFGRGAMVKEFDAAVYAMKQGEISNLVETDFGFHIIQLTGTRGGDKKPFEAVRAEVEAEVRKQLAQRRYAEAAEQFGNLVYEQSDSLQPAADKLKLKVLTATVGRQPQPGAQGPLASAKLLEAVFGVDALRNKRNTEAIETGPSQLVSARVAQYNPARVPALADVKDKVREQLVRKLAAEQAKKAGEARLAALKANMSDTAGLDAAVTLSRANPQGLSRAQLEAVLGADASKLPAAVGVVADDGGYVVVRINELKPRDAAVIDDKRAGQQYTSAWARAEAQAYLAALKSQYKAVIKVAPPASAASGP